VDTHSPEIIATGSDTYGLSNSRGTAYFYDGTIKGRNLAISKVPTEIEENTNLSADIATAKEIYLVQETGNVAKIEEIEYATLQEAIENCAEGQTIELLCSIPYFISDSPITIEAGKNIILNMAGHNIMSALEETTIQNRGNLTIQNGTIQASALENKGDMYIQNSHIQGTINNDGSMEIEDSTITAVHNTKGTIQMQSGTVGTIQDSEGTITQNEGTIQRLTTESGNITQNAGTIQGLTTTEGTVTQNAGTIQALTTNRGTVIQNDGTTGNIRNHNGTITILAGTVNYIYSTGTVNIGTKDGTVNIDNPIITGQNSEYYGITNDGGQLYFYDGTIKGATSAINGNITEIEEHTELVVSTDESGYEVVQLRRIEGAVASINGTEYEALQEAIDACPEGIQTTIQILRNGVVARAEIGNNQNVQLDLNGKTLSQYQALTNNGTLQIVDNSASKAGTITSFQRTAIQNNGSLTLESGTITGSTYGINNSGTVSIAGGTLENNTHGLYNTGIANISGGTFSNNQYGASQYGSGSATTTIAGGTFQNNINGTYVTSGTTTITGGTFRENTDGIYGTGGTIVVENAIFTTNENATNCAGGRMSVIGGSFSGNQYGALCTSGQLFAGIKDTSVSKEAPNIIGEVAGIKIQIPGIVHFYDGKIQGKEASIQGNVTYLEDGYKMKSEILEGYDTATLALSGTVVTVAKVGDVEFNNLQSAINSCIGEELETVTLINSVTTTETIRIAEDQKVLINLNKYTIEGAVNGSILDNLGTLIIQDSSTEKTGTIRNTAGVGIHNTGTLTLGVDDGSIEQTILVEGSTKAVENAGIFNYYDGTLKAITPLDGTITNLPEKAVVRTRTEDGKVVYYIG